MVVDEGVGARPWLPNRYGKSYNGAKVNKE